MKLGNGGGGRISVVSVTDLDWGLSFMTTKNPCVYMPSIPMSGDFSAWEKRGFARAKFRRGEWCNSFWRVLNTVGGTM